jgi:signal transduction histidine kinase
LVHHRAKFQQIRIVKQLEDSLPVVSDSGLQHAIVNLVKNAFDAMPQGGTLTISTRRTGSGVELTVEDTGPGIPEAIRHRIFEPFFTTKPIHQGSGLGLLIAKEVVERSGGTIDFTNREEGGTRFRIRVPLATPSAGGGDA